MENKTIGLVIAVAIALLMGAILISIISEQTVSKTAYSTSTEDVDLVNGRLAGNQVNNTYYYHLTYGCPDATAWRKDLGTECNTDNVVLTLKNGTLLTENTDYTWNGDNTVCTSTTVTDGDVVFLNTSILVDQAGSNTTTVTYRYCADDYVSGWASTVANLVPGFFALGLLIGGAFVIFWILRQEGIDINT